MRLESFLLWNLIDNEDYTRQVLPYLKEEYFTSQPHKLVFNIIRDFIVEYEKPPAREALYIELSDLGINENLFEEAKQVVAELECDKTFTLPWLLDKTEHFCKERAIHNALLDSIEISDNKPDERGKIPDILTDALSISFDTRIGHDYLDDWENRWDYYTRKEEKKPFSLELFNKITEGGLPGKTLTVILAGTGVGKSRFMTHEAAYDLEQGKNVLYLTLEMAEEKISERIDANLLDIDINEIKHMAKSDFQKRLERVKDKTVGKLIVKEYPPTTAGAIHFKKLLKEMELKIAFKPDVIYVDYINLCSSSRLSRQRTTSYEYIKAVAEELRGLAVEMRVPIITATQTNRSGFVSSDVGLEDTAESFGLPATADLMFALISTDELKELNQQMVKQLKNRLGDPGRNSRFVIGIDPLKMRYYDVDDSAQQDVHDGPVMDKTDFGERFDRDKMKDFF
jgi:archaellum biogenesis ATPase FlaH